MATSIPDRRQQILDAAVRTFAKHGFHKASIKQIAKAARLKSPALIYWYFKDKDELFRALLQQRSPLLHQLSAPKALEKLMDHPPEEVLPLIARAFFAAFDHPETVRLFRIFLSEAARSPEVASAFARNGPVPVIHFIVRYLQHQVKRGRLRPLDSQSAARSFMGTLVIYILGREIFPPLRTELPEMDRYLGEVISIFLDGIRPQEGK